MRRGSPLVCDAWPARAMCATLPCSLGRPAGPHPAMHPPLPPAPTPPPHRTSRSASARSSWMASANAVAPSVGDASSTPFLRRSRGCVWMMGGWAVGRPGHTAPQGDDSSKTGHMASRPPAALQRSHPSAAPMWRARTCGGGTQGQRAAAAAWRRALRAAPSPGAACAARAGGGGEAAEHEGRATRAVQQGSQQPGCRETGTSGGSKAARARSLGGRADAQGGQAQRLPQNIIVACSVQWGAGQGVCVTVSGDVAGVLCYGQHSM